MLNFNQTDAAVRKTVDERENGQKYGILNHLMNLTEISYSFIHN